MVLVTKLMKAPATLGLTFALLTGVAFVGCGEADTTMEKVEEAAEETVEATEEVVEEATEAVEEAAEGGSDKKE
jgi:basic membrane protein A